MLEDQGEKMTPEQFTYWLQGFVELHGEMPSEAQWESIKDHLQTVFVKVTPIGGCGGGGSLSEWPFHLKSPHTVIC
ncbi:TPA: hypothetical protein PFA69_004638 [Serratia marcescens]|nr:hypothetical protein [Serratia marcescens]